MYNKKKGFAIVLFYIGEEPFCGESETCSCPLCSLCSLCPLCPQTFFASGKEKPAPFVPADGIIDTNLNDLFHLRGSFLLTQCRRILQQFYCRHGQVVKPGRITHKGVDLIADVSKQFHGRAFGDVVDVKQCNAIYLSCQGQKNREGVYVIAAKTRVNVYNFKYLSKMPSLTWLLICNCYLPPGGIT